MRPYEEILNKISPLFYKLLNYSAYLKDQYLSGNVIGEYLKRSNIGKYVFYFKPRHIQYFFISTAFKFSCITLAKNICIKKKIFLTEENITKLLYFREDNLDMFIVNMIINNFSFENDYITLEGLPFQNLFIALVGRDTYDAIRANIK